MDSILIIDDEPQIRKLLSRMMELEGYEVFQAADCQSTLKQLKLHNPQVVLCDVFLPDGNGVDMVTTIKKLYPELEVILLTAHGNIPDGVQAIKNGAFDYITKGDDNNKIIPLISRAMAQAKKNVGEKVKTEETQSFSFDAIKGKSEGMQQAVALARKVSATDVTVLLTGETGTGKEVFAQAIHRNSLRKENAFVAVNCSAFSKDLLESEIFGHKAGSFTGAMKDKKGLFEVADNGTIFLKEVNAPEGLKAVSKFGDIRLDKAGSQKFELESSNGSITGSIRGREEEYQILVEKEFGDSNLQSKLEGKYLLDISTNFGDIDIRFEP